MGDGGSVNPRRRHSGRVAPPQRVANSVSRSNRIQAAQTTVSPASATTIVSASGSTSRSDSSMLTSQPAGLVPPNRLLERAIRSKSMRPSPSRSDTPSGSRTFPAISATGAITIVSVSSGTNPAASSRCDRSSGRSCPCSFLEALVALRKHAHLALDQLVEVSPSRPAEVAIDDEAAPSQTEEAHERPIPLDRDTSRQGVARVREPACRRPRAALAQQAQADPRPHLLDSRREVLNLLRPPFQIVIPVQPSDQVVRFVVEALRRVVQAFP